MKKMTVSSLVMASLLFASSLHASSTEFVQNGVNGSYLVASADTQQNQYTFHKMFPKEEAKDELKSEVKAKAMPKEAPVAKEAPKKVEVAPKKEEKSVAAPESAPAKEIAIKVESINPKMTVKDLITAVAGAKSSGSDAKAAPADKATQKKEGASKEQSDVFDYKLKPKKVAENVWCFFGALDKPTKENAGFMVNGCYIKTNDGYLVMDTGPSYQWAKQSYEAMSKIEKLPVKYVVNSHEHDDHWLGNDYFKKTFNATLIGPESINKNYKDGDQTRMFKVLPENAIRGTHIIKLDKIAKEVFTLTLGGEEFQIIPMDVKAHTGDDVFIYMPKRKVLFAGDLVMNGRITSMRHGSVMGQIKALAMMKKLDWKVLVPGHGYITDARAMDEADLYFKLLKERVQEAIEEGVDATEINEVVKLIEFKDKAMYDLLNAHNVGFAYDELEMLEE